MTRLPHDAWMTPSYYAYHPHWHLPLPYWRRAASRHAPGRFAVPLRCTAPLGCVPRCGRAAATAAFDAAYIFFTEDGSKVVRCHITTYPRICARLRADAYRIKCIAQRGMMDRGQFADALHVCWARATRRTLYLVPGMPFRLPTFFAQRTPYRWRATLPALLPGLPATAAPRPAASTTYTFVLPHVHQHSCLPHTTLLLPRTV